MSTIILILILLTAFPAGYILAYLTRDELKSGRRYFGLISFVSLIIALILLFIYRNIIIILTLLYITIVSLISVWKSYDEKFVKI